MSRQRSRSLAELRTVAGRHLDSYTDPAGPYAFSTYDLADVHNGRCLLTTTRPQLGCVWPSTLR